MKPIPESTLRAVYTREQPYRLHWPQDYETGMASPAIAGIVRTIALHIPTWGRRHADRVPAEGAPVGPLLPGRDLLGRDDGATVHPRPDERHIRAADVRDLAALLKGWPQAEYNIEGNPFHNLMAFVRDVRPHQATFVPDSEGQFTSDHGWTLEGQVFDARGYDTIYETPTFVSDEDLADEDLMETEIDKLSDTLANALEAMYVEVDNQLAAAIVTAKINRLAGYKVAIEQMMQVVGVDKAVLARRQVQLEAQLEAERKLLDGKAKTLDEQIEEQMAAMHKNVDSDDFCDILEANRPEPAKPKVKPAAERKAAREARLAAKAAA